MSTLSRTVVVLTALLTCATLTTYAQTLPTATRQWARSRTPKPFTRQQVIALLIRLQQLKSTPTFPTLSTPPPSNIKGLAGDNCRTHLDCEEPLWCDYCEKSTCSCVRDRKSRQKRQNHTCTSTSDCQQGEFCTWLPIYGLQSGVCNSSRANRDRSLFVLHTPLPVEPRRVIGRTGDRCILHSDCTGSRSCRGFDHLSGSVTGCEIASSACVCVPKQFEKCLRNRPLQEPIGQNLPGTCIDIQEDCRFIALDTFPQQTPSRGNGKKPIWLGPICLSKTTNKSAAPLFDKPISSTIPVPIEEKQASVLDRNGEKRIRIEALEPFTVPSLSRFNSFTTDDLKNDFISGVASLVILVYITNLVRGFMYAFPGIRKSRYNMYIIFSRLSRMRNVFRLLSAREEGLLSQFRNRSRRPIERNYRAMFIPLLAVIALYTAEIATIIAGSEVLSEDTSKKNFDPRIALVPYDRRMPQKDRIEPARRPRTEDKENKNCDDFFIPPQRGVLKRGKVLKCVEEIPNAVCEPYENTMQLNVRFGTGRMAFQVHSASGECAEIELSTFVRGVNGIVGRTMPFRPDLMDERERRRLLNGIFNGVRGELEYNTIDPLSDVWSVRELRGSKNQILEMEMYHKHEVRKSVNESRDALKKELRQGLDLVLNSTGAPWVFKGAYEFKPEPDIVIAIRKRYYVSHGALAIVVLLTSVAYLFLNSLLTHFDEVAYIAMKELIGDDCVLGPLTSNGRVEADVMAYDELVESGGEEDMDGR